MSESDAVSVIIVTRNSLPVLTECVKSIPAAADGLPWELIIIDNASSDGSADAVAQQIPSATIHRNEKNVGFAAACNQGAAGATGEWLFFLNPDVVLDSGALRTLISVMEGVSKAGLATMRLRHANGEFQPNCRSFPTITNLFLSRGSLLGRLLQSRLSPRASVYTLPDYQEITQVQAVSATAVAVRRELFRLLNGFDQRYFMYMEDTDLSYRLRLHGYVNLFVPQAGAVHGWGRGSSGGRIIRAWHHHQSVWKYFLKFHPTGFSLILLPVILFVNFLLVCVLPQRRK